MKTPDTPIRAVLFDFDGTLVDSEYLHHEAWLEAVEPWGVTLSWEEYQRRLVGISDRRACEFFLRIAGMAETPELMEQGRNRKHLVYRRRSIEELSIHPRVLDWIHRNYRSIPMGVVSSSAIPDAIPILDRQGVAQRMDFIICGDHVEHLKPDPMPYLLALDKLRAVGAVTDGRECLVFEDSATGVTAATDAGMRVEALNSPSDLADALERWGQRIPGAVASREHAVSN